MHQHGADYNQVTVERFLHQHLLIDLKNSGRIRSPACVFRWVGSRGGKADEETKQPKLVPKKIPQYDQNPIQSNGIALYQPFLSRYLLNPGKNWASVFGHLIQQLIFDRQDFYQSQLTQLFTAVFAALRFLFETDSVL